ncbi:MAG: hypothetical protein Q9182_004874 [Xanthomendoza sp. 2 TL-2023]
MVIDHLEKKRKSQKVAIAYAYCVHNAKHQTPINFIGNLLGQLAVQSPAFPEDIKSCYKQHSHDGTRPTLSDLSQLLASQVQVFGKVFILIDALDECPDHDGTRASLLSKLHALPASTKLMVTSRDLPSIANLFKDDLRLDVRAREEDIKLFIESQMEQRRELNDLLENRDDLRSMIVKTIVETSNGMFLIAVLHIDSLAKEDNIRDLKESLNHLPKDLDNTYDDAMKRIKGQDSRKSARAEQVLKLISCATRPLKLKEIQTALSIRPGDTFLDPEAIPKAESFVSTCCGLVVVEDESTIVRLVHYTTEEYFNRKLQCYRGQAAHHYVSGVLITYLSFHKFRVSALEEFATMNIKSKVDKKAQYHTKIYNYVSGNKLRTSPKYYDNDDLVIYAAQNWDYHTRSALRGSGDASATTSYTYGWQGKLDEPWDLVQSISRYLENDDAIEFSSSLYQPRRNRQYKSYGGMTSLHFAAFLGIPFFVKKLLDQGAEVDAPDFHGWTPLHIACNVGHVEVVQLLLDVGAAIDFRGEYYKTALWLAAKDGRDTIARLLLSQGTNVDADFHGITPLHIACEQGHVEVVQSLLDFNADTNIRGDNDGRNALHLAARSSVPAIVRLVLNQGVEVNARSSDKMTPLHIACLQENVEIVQSLLDFNADINLHNNKGENPLHFAARSGVPAIVRLLLNRGMEVNVRSTDGSTPLHQASRFGHIEFIQLLLDFCADVNYHNLRGMNALYRAVSSDKLEMAQLLFEKGGTLTVVEISLLIKDEEPKSQAMLDVLIGCHDKCLDVARSSRLERPMDWEDLKRSCAEHAQQESGSEVSSSEAAGVDELETM